MALERSIQIGHRVNEDTATISFTTHVIRRNRPLADHIAELQRIGRVGPSIVQVSASRLTLVDGELPHCNDSEESCPAVEISPCRGDLILARQDHSTLPDKCIECLGDKMLRASEGLEFTGSSSPSQDSI